ncbi:MAG: CRISPR-associated endonuclease Cas1 [Acidobacteria bacterium]|nr:MAG: CRISPR-associated endonuclease Cas1 [Acidobacteriota bacterium]
MRTLAIEEQNARLALRNEIFTVEKSGAVLAQVRAAEVSQVALFGSVELTPAARALLLRRGIDTVFLTVGGRYRGRLVGPAHGAVGVRIGQYRRLMQVEDSLTAARECVRGKIVNQRRLMLRAQNRRPDPARAGTIVRMDAVRRAVERAREIDEVRGLEGAASALYFQAFGGLLINPEFTFTDRNRRPPRDPVNAMLSFCYALLLSLVEGAVYRAGLDPHFGALHAPRHGVPALALDLMEEFRPVAVDSLVVELVNRGSVGPADFARLPTGPEAEELLADEVGGPPESRDAPPPKGPPGVHLAETGRRIVLRAFYARMRRRAYHPGRDQRLSLSQIIVEQAYAFARWCEGRSPAYRAYTPR